MTTLTTVLARQDMTVLTPSQGVFRLTQNPITGFELVGKRPSLTTDNRACPTANTVAPFTFFGGTPRPPKNIKRAVWWPIILKLFA